MSETLPRLYEGYIEWECWSERQRVILALDEFKEDADGRWKAVGLELYAIGTFFRSVPIELELFPKYLRFSLKEVYPERRSFEKPPWDGVYGGSLLHGVRVLATEANLSEPCMPDLVLRAVSPE